MQIRSVVKPNNNFKENNTLARMKKYKDFYILLIPGIVYFVLMKYLPMFGITIAFKNYSPFKGFFGSPWVGFGQFIRLFNSPDFWLVFRNTMLISLYKLVFGFPIPIILSLLLNELRNLKYKRTIQTVIYLPHFVSWVILGGIMVVLLSPNTGIVNYILKLFGFEPIFFLANGKWFRSVLVISDIYKECGWGTIVYLAAISSIDTQVYEAAEIDGASRWKQIWSITLPSIKGIIVTMLILRVGRILDVGFHQILVLYNPAVYEVADVFKTFAYRVGLTQNQFSFATAIELFKGIISFILVVIANKAANLIDESGIW